MTTPHNPYATPPSLHVSASLEEYVDPMEEASPKTPEASPESENKTTSDHYEQEQSQQDNNKAINVEEEEPLPPLFHRTITEEHLCDDDHPYMFWASLRIPIPENPDDPVATMYNHLEQFINQMLDTDAHFSVFPHNLSDYESLNNIPELIKDPDQLPTKVDKWLKYFPGARLWARRGYMYTQVLLGFHEPFPKVIKATVSWFQKSKFRLSKSSLQSEKLISLGWLLFSANTMDIKVLRGEISVRIASIPVGLRWKMISMGTQGSVPKEQQVKALHLYVNELDIALAKPRLMEVYTSKLAQGHTFPLHI